MLQLKKLLLSSAVLVLAIGLWVASAYADGFKTATVTASNLNLRSGPGRSYNVVEALPKDLKVVITDHTGDWYKVKTPRGYSGWVCSTYLAVMDSTVSRGDDTVIQPNAGSNLGQQMVSYAKKLLGIPYVYGGTTPDGFDCSGFVQYVYNHFGINIERVAANQASDGTKVSIQSLKPGDLVFFDTDGGHNYINHVGMYIGNGQFIQASSGHSAHKVVISDLTGGFYAGAFMTARRFF